MVVKAKGEDLRLYVKDEKTGKEGWMKAEVFVNAIAESLEECGFIGKKDNNIQ